MAVYILKRILMMIPVLLGVAFIIFFIMSMTPGDPAVQIMGEGATAEAIEAKREELGLNDPLIVRYVKYCINAVQGDFGISYRTSVPVFEEIASRLPVTLNLAIVGIIIAILIGIPIGVLSAVKQYSAVDNLSRGISLLLTSLPGFWLGMLMMLVFSLQLHVLPSMGAGSWKHYIMPAIASSSSTMASVLRMTRSTMLEVIRQDYIRTARAKGATERKVIFGHALRNALLPVVTIIGVNFGMSLGGAIVTEQVFAMPGLGQLMINSIRTKDIPMVIASVLFAAMMASIMNLLVDIVYTFIDPRLKAQFVSSARKRKAAKA